MSSIGDRATQSVRDRSAVTTSQDPDKPGASEERKRSASQCSRMGGKKTGKAAEVVPAGKKNAEVVPAKMKKAEAIPATATVSKAPEDPSQDFGERLNKLEDMFARVMDKMEAMNRPSSSRAFDHDAGASSDLSAHVERESHMFTGGLLDEGNENSSLIYDESQTDYLGQTPSDSEAVPAIAAKFALPTGIGAPVEKTFAQSVTYMIMISHQLEEKI